MSVVYIIYSVSIDKFYIGYSDNFEQRIALHNAADNNNWTIKGQPWIQFLVMPVKSKKQGLRIERYIKNQKSRKYIIKLKEDETYRTNLLLRFKEEL